MSTQLPKSSSIYDTLSVRPARAVNRMHSLANLRWYKKQKQELTLISAIKTLHLSCLRFFMNNEMLLVSEADTCKPCRMIYHSLHERLLNVMDTIF